MANLITESLESSIGIGFLPAISLIIFMILFIGVIIYVIKADKTLINKMKNIPFEEDGLNNKTVE